MPIFRIATKAALAAAALGAFWLHGQKPDAGPPWSGLEWRQVNFTRGGRVVAVAGVPSQPNVYYFGGTGGGVFKTTDAGVSWSPVSDGQFGTGTVGALAVADSDPNIIYAGMGEPCIRGNASHGDGVYKSTDAGRTWKQTGLGDTRHIAAVRVHPRNPDLVYVAALGHQFGPSEQRGVYRSADGGKTWKQILTHGPKAGAIDLAFDPANASILYAAFWEVYRTPWSLESGGPGSGLAVSNDGGDTWKDLTTAAGMPKGPLGRIGIAVSPANPQRIWAMIEAPEGGVYRSDNGGKNWARVNESRSLRQRAWYYTHIFADPASADTVYVANTNLYKSVDGGRTYTALRAPHGDHHALWIAPDDPRRMINGNDGGANVSANGGRTWSRQDNQPTAQFYRVALDQDYPYNIYGAQQDNTTVRVSSRPVAGGERDWWPVGGGESGWIAPSPRDSNVVFAGSYGGLITRYDHRSGAMSVVTIWPDNPMGAGAEAMKYRFQWNFPLLFSPHDPDRLYAGGSVLFETTDAGQSWRPVSGDLTRNDKSKQGSSGGPITKDNTSVEYYDTIFTVTESRLARGTIWVGTDDGLVQLTRDGGKNWTNVTPGDLPEWSQINSIEASPHDAGTAYVAATRYKWDDFRPYLYKTTDYGRTWTAIGGGIPETAFTRVIREDPKRKGLLAAGTETGIHVSFDGGARWQSLQMNLPVVPVTDLAFHERERELVVATQGRTFWVLDDLSVLEQMNGALDEAVRLFEPRHAYRPSAGVRVSYFLKDKPQGEVSLEFLDAGGKLIRKFSNKDIPEKPDRPPDDDDDDSGPAAAPATVKTEAGLNRFLWDMRYPDATRFPGLILWAGSVRGPLAIPGKYQARLTVDGKASSQSFEIRKDPRLATTPEQYARQLELSLQIRDKLSLTHQAIIEIRQLRGQLDALLKRLDDRRKPVIEAGKALAAKLTAVEEALYQTRNQSSQDPLNYPIRLNNKLAALGSVVANSDSGPTRQSSELFEDLSTQINAELQKLEGLRQSGLAAFNRLVREQEIPAVEAK